MLIFNISNSLQNELEELSKFLSLFYKVLLIELFKRFYYTNLHVVASTFP